MKVKVTVAGSEGSKTYEVEISDNHFNKLCKQVEEVVSSAELDSAIITLNDCAKLAFGF